MATSIPSSPSVGGASPERLTPRSKIRALLATVESSDEDSNNSPTKAKQQKLRPALAQPSQNLFLQTEADEDEDEGDSDIEIRPRGRLAARMHATKSPNQSPRNESNAIENVHIHDERSRNADAQQGVASGPEDEDELPVAPRRLKRRARVATSTQGSPVARSNSPGLFVSSPIRPSPSKSVQHDSASENELPSLKSDRFKALVERKRQERLAREAAEEAKRAERREKQDKLASELEQMQSDDNDRVSDITDDEGGRRLSQMARPMRKASKKAIEEMNQETQRMARSMQLAHEARTRKKITKASLFERFNYKPHAGLLVEPKTTSSSQPGTPESDIEMEDISTPPSSPPLAGKSETIKEGSNTAAPVETNNHTQDKGKGKDPETRIVQASEMAPPPPPKRQVRVRIPLQPITSIATGSDDELEITRSAKDNIDAVFNSIPSKKAKASHSLQALRALAHLRSPGRDNRAKNIGMSPGELQDYLQQKVRQQAKVERDRRLEMLQAQGVVIHTVEERERQMQEVEDIVAKAREEAQKIMEQERAAAKQERKANGEADPLGWDDSDDEEYEASADEADEEGSAVELSGSEDEDENERNDSDEEMEEDHSVPTLEEKTFEAASEGFDINGPVNQAKEEDAEELPTPKHRRSRKQTTVLSDDEAEVESTPRPKETVHLTPGTAKTASPAIPTSVLRSAKKNFIPGLPVQGPAGLGLTQIFAGTMDDSQMSPIQGPTQSLMPDFDHFPDSNFSATAEESSEIMILDSQREETHNMTQAVALDFSQSQMRGMDSLLREESALTDVIEMSQDGGFQEHTPLKDRFFEAPVSTVETVVADPHAEEPHESPLVRRGRLRRRIETSTLAEHEVSASVNVNAFEALKDATKQLQRKEITDEFNRKKSKAKEMIEEQAEESEDEYAGLGGADGEDSDNDSLASLEEIIDDTTNANADADKLAAFYMDRERANDEKEVEKLFKDVTTGMLRRKRGADYDLSDSDDGGEARRRMKRRQFAKMQKALFTDERVKKMAENPGNQAFLRSIEDQGSDDEMNFLDIVDEPSQREVDSQSQEDNESSQPRVRTVSNTQQQVPLGGATENNNRHPRRTKDGKKPSNIGEVRETLSDLLEEPQGSIIPATEVDSDSEGEDRSPPPNSDKENVGGNPRRGRVAVVDRISLKRQSSSALSANNSRVAFAVAASSTSFKVPALLRRATTNSLISGSAGSTTSTAAPSSGAGFGEDAKIKKTAGKRSGVNAFARENERRAKIQESERRREERKVKDAKRRIGMVGGLLAQGSFE
ncbi:Mediator of replication checkpoint protein [Paramyrothecium foliicola]|nr:Mediator of replication checkpoint protein [Paramyrothecium foliicola]